MPINSPSRFDAPPTDDATQAYLGGEIRRQRMIVVMCAAVVGIGLVLALAGVFGHGDPPRTGEPELQARAASPNGDGVLPFGNTGGDKTGAKTEGAGGAASGDSQKPPENPTPGVLRSQSAARVVEPVAIVAFPWREKLARDSWMPPDAAEWMPAEKVWLPTIVEDIGLGIIDRNRVLEEAGFSGAAQMLPRCGKAIDSVELETIAMGAGVKHLVVVEFPRKGESWRIWGYRYGMDAAKVAKPPETPWPTEKATATLTAGITAVLETLTGYDLDGEKAFTDDDGLAKQYSHVRELIATGIEPVAPELPVGDQVDKLLTWVPQGKVSPAPQPGMELALYRAVFALRQAGNAAAALRRLEVYTATGGKNRRLRTQLAWVYNDAAPAESRGGDGKPADGKAVPDASGSEKAEKLAAALIAEDRLNMSARAVWAQTHYSKPGTGGSIKMARDGIAEYPQDGRYHIMLVRELGVNPQTVPEALKAADKARELSPWESNLYFHVATAHLTLANSAIGDANNEATRANKAAGKDSAAQAEALKKAGEARAKAAKEFELASTALATGWSNNPNRISLWLETLVRAQTQNGRRLPAPGTDAVASKELLNYIFLRNEIAHSFVQTQFTTVIRKLFEPSLAERIADLKATVAASKPSDPLHELHLLAGAAEVFLDFSAAQSKDEAKAKAPAVKAAMLKYLMYGGRAPQVVDAYKQVFSNLIDETDRRAARDASMYYLLWALGAAKRGEMVVVAPLSLARATDANAAMTGIDHDPTGTIQGFVRGKNITTRPGLAGAVAAWAKNDGKESAATNGWGVEVGLSLWEDPGLFPPTFKAVEVSRLGGEVLERKGDLGSLATEDKMAEWVDKKTHGFCTLERLGEVKRSALMYRLLSTAYLKADWTEKFDLVPESVSPRFERRKGDTVSAPFMMSPLQVHPLYLETESFHMASLAYKGDRLRLTLLVPTDGHELPDIVKALTPDGWSKWKAEGKPKEGTVLMPKARPQSSLKASAFFQGGIFEATHSACIRFDETGTEGAALTDAPNFFGVEPEKPIPFRLVCDRPFLFVLEDAHTGFILLAGRLQDPTQESLGGR
jgi:hypothetical protein